MKKRMLFTFTDKDGFTWRGDCPRWAAATRATGRYVEGRTVMYTQHKYSPVTTSATATPSKGSD